MHRLFRLCVSASLLAAFLGVALLASPAQAAHGLKERFIQYRLACSLARAARNRLNEINRQLSYYFVSRNTKTGAWEGNYNIFMNLSRESAEMQEWLPELIKVCEASREQYVYALTESILELALQGPEPRPGAAAPPPRAPQKPPVRQAPPPTATPPATATTRPPQNVHSMSDSRAAAVIENFILHGLGGFGGMGPPRSPSRGGGVMGGTRKPPSRGDQPSGGASCANPPPGCHCRPGTNQLHCGGN